MAEDFNTFWEQYGRKRERSDAERAWQRLTDDERRAAIKGIAAYHRRCMKEGKATSYPAAYLNQKNLWKKTKGRPPKSAKKAVRPAGNPFDEMEMW